MITWQGIPISDGTGQRERMPKAFAPNYFNVDEQSFEQLLTKAAEIAAHIKYYDIGNRVSGHWGNLFYSDEAVIMATILSVDLGRLESGFRAISYHNKTELVIYLVSLAKQVDFWFKHLAGGEHQSAKLLRHKIETLIGDKLAPELHNLGWIAEALEIDSEINSTEFSNAWCFGEPASDNLFPLSTIRQLPTESSIKQRLSATFYTFSNSIAYFQKAAEELLHQSLESEQHEPAIGLFMVFLQLYKKAQNQINRFTEQHLRFYYRKVIEVGSRAQQPDSYYLLLQSRPDAGRIRIGKNTAFSAGKNADLKDIVYRADENILVSDTIVASLATLYCEHHPLVSPESDLGYVSRIKSNHPSVESDPSDLHSSMSSAWPLFGAAKEQTRSISSTDSRMGFALASPMLLLAEGRRIIEICFELESVLPGDLETRFKGLLNCQTRQAFQRQFGEVFALYLLRFKGGLSEQVKCDLVGTAKRLMPPLQANEISALLQQDWQGLFYRLFKQPLKVMLTSDSGWMEIADAVFLPINDTEKSAKTGFRLLIDLAESMPPVSAYQAHIHGDEIITNLPVLRCELNSQSHFCVYSVFQQLMIAELEIGVEVHGVKNMQIYNQNGQLDAGKPFQPFGPLPGSGSYFVFGNREMAHKPVKKVSLQFEWAGLPAGTGGFNEYYAGYPVPLSNDSFEVEFSSLTDGRWMPEDKDTRACFKLFETRLPGNGVETQNSINIHQLPRDGTVAPGIESQDFAFNLQARSGFHRLTLVHPSGGFGHADYTRLLTSVLTANAKKKKPDPVPNLPYTPTMDRISIGYTARSSIKPALDNDGLERVFHLHPFGIDTAYPPLAGQHCSLFPKYEHEGYLFIGLKTQDLSGPITLLFHLAQDSADIANAGNTDFEWSYLTAERWIRLPDNRILADSTHGFLTSGAVTLDIPADVSLGNRMMPVDCYWIRLSVSRAAAAFPSCYLLKPHALKVSRQVTHDEIDTSLEGPDSENTWVMLDSKPGITSVTPVYKAFAGLGKESEDEFKQRVSERLRHKNRALTPRDYEQLVLQQFPEISKVKCFNSLSRIKAAYAPGHVLIVVVPQAEFTNADACGRERADVSLLERIDSYLKELCPPFVSLEVINPTYEQVQVRCTVKFSDALREGVNLKRLNQQISEYLCPWKAPGYEARFGWSIHQRDIESHILNLGYIESVTNFSMLHITTDEDGSYHLFDTAKVKQNREAVIQPNQPWSLAIPMRNHFLETMRQTKTIEAQVTGIDELEIGGTFIIGNREHGEEK